MEDVSYSVISHLFLSMVSGLGLAGTCWFFAGTSSIGLIFILTCVTVTSRIESKTALIDLEDFVEWRAIKRRFQ